MIPKVSIITPCYYAAPYISGLLDMTERNAARLDIPPELILVNDSPEEKLRLERKTDFPVRIITNPKNCGIHASRVNGLREARGEYILFLDQDDRISDDCLESQLACIRDADFSVSNGYETEISGEKRPIFNTPRKQSCSAELSCQYYYNNLIRSPGQVLIRRGSIPDRWTEHIMKNNGSDDAFLWILMLCEGRKPVYNPAYLYEHISTGENTSGDLSGMLRSQVEVTELLRGIASPSGLRAFRRRAEYYCLRGPAHALRYADVRIQRALYSKRHF